jgi:RimJ/RimL family protein N-acetyltransferase
VLTRKIHFKDRGLYADHLKRLSADDRRLRFAKSGTSDNWIDSYISGISPHDLILGEFIDTTLVGAIHVAVIGTVAEIGVSVDAAHRASGVGSDLFERGVAWCRNRRMVKLYTLCLSDNRATIALARRNGMSLTSQGAETEAFLDLEPPTPLTVSQEISAGLYAVYHDWSELLDAYSSLLKGT